MKTNDQKIRRVIFAISLVLLIGWHPPGQHKASYESRADNNVIADPLPSWNEGEVKQTIISYVASVSDPKSKNFIPEIDRIATFDNDGTLWAERPYVQELFAFYQAKKMVEKKPVLKTQQP